MIKIDEITLDKLKQISETEDNIEFKRARRNFNYGGGDRIKPNKRRRCLLGYITALCNEGGGFIILGVNDEKPCNIVGTDFAQNEEKALEDKVYQDIKIRIET